MIRFCRVHGCTNLARPQRHLCQTHRERVRRHGDLGFTQWTEADETDVQLLIDQRRLPDGTTRLERRLVALGLSDQGLSARDVAAIVGVAPRTVHRWRTERQMPRKAA